MIAIERLLSTGYGNELRSYILADVKRATVYEFCKFSRVQIVKQRNEQSCMTSKRYDEIVLLCALARGALFKCTHT